MTDSEKLDLLINHVYDMKADMQTMNERMDGLELQIKSTERSLKNQIMKSESMILCEVERVHEILDKHTHDLTRHTA